MTLAILCAVLPSCATLTKNDGTKIRVYFPMRMQPDGTAYPDPVATPLLIDAATKASPGVWEAVISGIERVNKDK